MDELRPGRGRLVLRTLAVLSALGFLTLVMVQAMAFYAPPPPPAPKPEYGLIAPSTKDSLVVFPPEPTTPFDLGVGTKSAPVVPPTPLVDPRRPQDRAYLGATKSLTVVPPPPLVQPKEPDHRAYLGATKAGILGPLKVSPPAPAPQLPGTQGRERIVFP